MFRLKPGSMAMIVGARTAAGRRNIGKSVELFGLCQPGQRFVNPVNGVMTQLPPRQRVRCGWSPVMFTPLITSTVLRLFAGTSDAAYSRRDATQRGCAGDRLITVYAASPPVPARDSAPYFSPHRVAVTVCCLASRQAFAFIRMLRQLFTIGFTERGEIYRFTVKAFRSSLDGVSALHHSSQARSVFLSLAARVCRPGSGNRLLRSPAHTRVYIESWVLLISLRRSARTL